MRIVRYIGYFIGKMGALGFIFVGGGFLAVLITPLVLLAGNKKQDRAQYFIRLTFRFYLSVLQMLGLIELRIDDAEKFAACEGQMVIANHPSLLDVVILMALIPRTQCIVKNELWNHPFLGALMRCAGYIRNDLPPETLVAACDTALKQGRCLIIFPEGTRTVPGQPLHFQRGFANIATLTNAAIQTVIIRCDPPFLFKNEPLWHIPARKPRLHLSLGEHLDAQNYSLYGERSINARKLVESLELYYGPLARYVEP